MHIPQITGLQDQRHCGTLSGTHQMLLHTGDRQQRRNRHMALVDAAVGENHDVLSVSHRPVHCDTQLVQRLFQGSILIINSRNRLRVKARLIQRPDLDQIHTGQDRVVDLQHTAVRTLFLQQIPVGPDVDRSIRNDLLPQRVDRRVCHLGKQLLEIMKQRRMMPGQHSQRHIMPHGHRRLRPGARHRKDLLLHVLVGIAKSLVQLVPDLLRVHRDLFIGNGQMIQMQQAVIQPLAVWLFPGIARLTLLVGEDALFFHVNKQHPAGLESRLFHNMRGIDVQHAHLGGQDHLVLIRNIIPGGPQTVAVKRRAGQLPVGEQDGRRSVPGLHHRRIVMVEISPLLIHESIVLPRLRNRDHHRQRQFHSIHVQKLQRVVQHGGVRTGGCDHRIDLVQILLQHAGGHGLLPRAHAVHVAADGIDLPVVRDHPVGMRAVPGRGRIGGKA